MKKDIVVKNEDWLGIAKDIIQTLSMGIEDKATLLTLKGDLGVGKTTLTQNIALVLGIKENIISPTFVIMKKYDLKDDTDLPWHTLIHIDAYRLKEYKDLEVLEWQDLISNNKNLIILEWPQCVGDNLNPDLSVHIEHIDEHTRKLIIH